MSKLPKSHRKPFSGYSNSKKVSFARSTFGVISFVSRSFKRIALSLICLVGAIGFSTISPSGASTGTTSSNTILYAAASSTGIGNCADANDACDLATALTKVTAGETIDLVTPGSTNSYEGNFTLNTNGTSLTAPITIQPAPGVTNPTLDGNNSGTVLTINTNVYVNLIGVTITGGKAAGGGINNSGTLTATNDTISNNKAYGGQGGGIYNSGTLTATNSTISKNSALGGGSGGGIYNSNSGTLTATNDTISNNSADYGGGIMNFGSLTATNDTISHNSDGLGGAIENGGSTFTLAASIVADQVSGPDCAGSSPHITDAGYNLTDGSSCQLLSANGSIIKSSTLTLQPLAPNGGPTQTIAIDQNSPAYNAIPVDTGLCGPTATVGKSLVPNGITVPSTDQRGYQRPESSNPNFCSIGSYQYTYAPIITSISPSGTYAPGSVVTVTGSNFFNTKNLSDITGITIDNVAVVTYSVNSNTSITLTVPSGIITSTDSPLVISNSDGPSLAYSISTVASPSTLYVSQKGSDKNNTTCIQVTPCLTIANAITNANNGDTINVGSSSATSPFREAVTVSKDLTITGQGATSTFVGGTSSTNNMVSGSVFTVDSGITATITAMTVQYGDGSNGYGGGIFNKGTLTATNDTISNNRSSQGSGGGIANKGTLTATNDTISNNRANSDGGGIYNANSGTLTATNDTISNNRANSGGGGIYNDNFGTLTATNDTISNNRANNGGGIYNSNSGTLTATNDTISNNRANNSGGGIYNSGTLTLAADLIANTSGAPSGGECGGYVTKITDLGYNVADDNTCGFPSSPTANKSTSIVSIASENLGPLQNNGGPTQTILPLPGNPAIGLIPIKTVVTIGTSGPSITLCPTTDQRGISASGPYCNAGSVQQTPQVITTTFPYPAPPQLNNPTPISPTSITLSWSQSTNQSYLPATGYNIFEGTTSGKESTTPISCTTPLTASSTSCTVTNLNPSTTYYFYIEATNTSGSSLPSNEVSITTLTTNQSPSTQNPSTTTKPGYYVVAKDGGVFSYGSATFYGSLANKNLNQPIVGIASTLDGKGYWLVAADGGVFSFGDAAFYGSLPPKTLNKPIVGIASTPDGKGYWLVASDGGVFSFGDAVFYGSLPPKTLNKPIVGIASTPDGKGYWLVASDGGVFSFGDAVFYGSLPPKTLNKPIVGIASTPDGKGYWLVASDGGVFSFGDAVFYGSLPPKTLNKPIVGIASTPDGKGYWLVASDGGVFSFGDAAFYGSLPPKKLNEQIDAITVG
ncbi:choice-of-anchor Q domain-containing protein [Acidithrix sp. C25]|uniref:beta strand repeat-containing protein n=1 Tax=Acidithrix sp. C25 TaxID=1671482 RepID=UPI00191BC979|nr:choice-of-anchor Q domain-containing protein [Acidithrix sp. C25]CAG4929313.1 unnamed protein product [Acidithrix sp. C25]